MGRDGGHTELFPQPGTGSMLSWSLPEEPWGVPHATELLEPAASLGSKAPRTKNNPDKHKIHKSLKFR